MLAGFELTATARFYENEARRGGRRRPPPTLPPFVQPGRDPSARRGACSVKKATALGRLLASTTEAFGKHLRGHIVGAGVAPEFMPKRNSALIGNGGRAIDDSARLEIGEEEGADPAQVGSCFVGAVVLRRAGS